MFDRYRIDHRQLTDTTAIQPKCATCLTSIYGDAVWVSGNPYHGQCFTVGPRAKPKEVPHD